MLKNGKSHSESLTRKMQAGFQQVSNDYRKAPVHYLLIDFLDDTVVKVEPIEIEEIEDTTQGDRLHAERVSLEQAKRAFLEEQLMFERQAQEKKIAEVAQLEAERQEIASERLALFTLRQAIEAEKTKLSEVKDTIPKEKEPSVSVIEKIVDSPIKNTPTKYTGTIPKVLDSVSKKQNSSEIMPELIKAKTPPKKSG